MWFGWSKPNTSHIAKANTTLCHVLLVILKTVVYNAVQRRTSRKSKYEDYIDEFTNEKCYNELGD